MGDDIGRDGTTAIVIGGGHGLGRSAVLAVVAADATICERKE